MDKINFQNGVTKVNADTFNTFQNNIYQMQNEIGVIVSQTEPTGDNRRKVWMQHSNNIFNKMTSTKNQYIDDGGNYGPSDTSNLSDFIPIIPNTNYIAKGYGNTAQNKRIAFFDSSKAFISTKTSLNDTNSTFYFKTLSNASYIRVQYFKDIEDSLDITIEPKIYVKNDNDVYEEVYDESKMNKINYSTEEQFVGKWIDGKNLYRKTITINDLKYGEEMILSQISNADSIFVKNSYVINSTSGYTTSIGTYYPVANRESRIWTDAKTGYIKAFLGTAWQNIVNQLVATIEYTKTMD